MIGQILTQPLVPGFARIKVNRAHLRIAAIDASPPARDDAQVDATR